MGATDVILYHVNHGGLKEYVFRQKDSFAKLLMEGKWQRDSCSFLGLVGGGRSLVAFPELEFGTKGVIEFTFPKASRGGWTQADMGFTQADVEF